ncbi:MAG: hypothetical protein JXL97_04525 [Bacteroidales bacterium]|nr:hypothetical protein [Bacteroidales bacterium]
MKQISLIIIISALSLNIFAQKDIVYEKVDEYDYFETQNYGVNGKHFLWGYYDVSFYTPNPFENQIGIKYGSSYSLTYGFKYKLKIFNWFSTGLDVNYNIHNFSFKNQFLSTYPSSANTSEKLVLNNIGSEFYLRFFIGKHGNTMGKYFDLGAYGTYNFSNRHILKIKNATPNYFFANQQKIVNKNLAYIENIQYGGVLRIGYNGYAIVAKYRFSDLFSNDFLQIVTPNDLPRFTIGFELSIL